MGTSLSSQRLCQNAKSIQDDGAQQEYEDLVKVAQVLNESDSMEFNEYLSPLTAQDELQLDSLYFLLPLTKLQYPLRASEMAALPVNGATVWQSRQHKPKINKRHRGSRIVPAEGEETDGRQVHKPHLNHVSNSDLLKFRILAQESMRVTSTWTKFGRDKYKSSWRANLTPIPEHFAY